MSAMAVPVSAAGHVSSCAIRACVVLPCWVVMSGWQLQPRAAAVSWMARSRRALSGLGWRVRRGGGWLTGVGRQACRERGGLVGEDPGGAGLMQKKTIYLTTII